MACRSITVALVLGSLGACAPVDVDVPAHLVVVETDCLGELAEISFLVPDLDVEKPICLLDPQCDRASSALGGVPQVDGPPGLELIVWAHDERGLERYTARVRLGTDDGIPTFIRCDADADELGVPIACLDDESRSDPINPPSVCVATFRRP